MDTALVMLLMFVAYLVVRYEAFAYSEIKPKLSKVLNSISVAMLPCLIIFGLFAIKSF